MGQHAFTQLLPAGSVSSRPRRRCVAPVGLSRLVHNLRTLRGRSGLMHVPPPSRFLSGLQCLQGTVLSVACLLWALHTAVMGTCVLVLRVFQHTLRITCSELARSVDAQVLSQPALPALPETAHWCSSCCSWHASIVAVAALNPVEHLLVCAVSVLHPQLASVERLLGFTTIAVS